MHIVTIDSLLRLGYSGMQNFDEPSDVLTKKGYAGDSFRMNVTARETKQNLPLRTIT